MRKYLLLISFFPFLISLTYPVFLFGKDNPPEEVQVGDQIWMVKNLDVTHFRNGDKIPHARTNNEWRMAALRGEPAWCYYDNNPQNGATYGKLYNWYAITDPRGIGPENWRVPSNDDWKKLEVSLGMSQLEVEKKEWRGAGTGNKLRQQGSKLWLAPNAGANNQSGFSALPGGYRQPGGVFETKGVYGSWWTSTAYDDQLAYYRDLSSMNSGIYKGAYPKGCGFSVRLVKEIGSGYEELPDLIDDRDDNVYKVVKIGNQVWMAENLRYLPVAQNNGEFIEAGNSSSPGFGVAGYSGNDLVVAKSHENYKKYGVLYNWWAATYGGNASDLKPSGVQGICPDGWHLPSDAEWEELINFLGGEGIAGNKMKSSSGWDDGGNGTNSSGFNALPGGMRNYDGRSGRMGGFGYWWSSSEFNTDRSFARRLISSDDEISKNHSSNKIGRSVRCIASYDYLSESSKQLEIHKEEIDIELAQTPDQTEHHSKPSESAEEEHYGEDHVEQDTDVSIILEDYVVIEIGDHPDQVWMGKNLNVDMFSNGDPIPHAVTLGDWIDAGNEGKPAWSYYDNDPAYGETVGKLYNWYAVNDPRGLCPPGWRVPSAQDFDMMVTTSGGMEYPYEYEDLIYGGYSGWNGFFGGWRHGNSGPTGFGRLGEYGYWWTSTDRMGGGQPPCESMTSPSSQQYADNPHIAWHFGMYFDEAIWFELIVKDIGLSVRCIKE